MKIFCAIKLVIFSGLFMVVICFGQDISPGDFRGEVQVLCQKGELVSAFHAAMKSLMHAQARYGREHLNTAECMVSLGDVAKLRGKHYLAEKLYNKALSIEEKTLGPKDPKVISCKLKLTRLWINDSE
ncbi:MAG: tetratricopeptide repeat protein [Desulfomonilaceae bacterium]